MTATDAQGLVCCPSSTSQRKDTKGAKPEFLTEGKQCGLAATKDDEPTANGPSRRPNAMAGRLPMNANLKTD